MTTSNNFNKTAAIGNFLQRNQSSNLASQMKPPGFNQPNVQGNQGNQSRYQGNNFNSNQNRGANLNHQNHQGQVFQPPVYQVSPYQVPTPQIQGVSKTDFENYVKANDTVLNNVQNQGQNLQNQMANVTSFSKTLEEPSIPLVPTPDVSISQNESNQNPETSTEKVQNPNLENTAHVLPPEEEESIFMEIPKPKAKKTVNVEIQDLNSPRPNSYPSKLPYPERMKVRENDKPSAKYPVLKMFKQLRLEIGLKDALVEMPKFNKWLSSLLRNKEKLEEIAITTVNAECSAIIMNKVPEKLEDPGKFLIPCALQELNRTSALADSGASINLLPHSIYKKLGLEALTPTRMTLELANRSITHPMGIAEDVVVRVDGFTFLADFVVVKFEPDPRVPIILGRPFLRTTKALIDLYEEKLTLRVGKEELVYYADKSEKNKDKNFVHAISIIDFSKDDPFSGSTTNTLPPSSSPVKTSDNFEKFADELAPLDSLPPGSDDSTLKKDLHEENFQVYSNPLFEFDDNFKSSNMNPLFEENNKDVKIKSSSSFTLTSPKESDSIPPGIDLTLPPTLKVSSSNPTSPTLTGEKNIPRGTLLVFKEPSFLLHPPKPPDECLKNVVLNEDFYQSKKTLPLNVEDVDSFTFIIWTFLHSSLYTKDHPLNFSPFGMRICFDRHRYLFVNISFVTIADEITLDSLTEEQSECFIEYYHENYPEDFKSELENLEEIYKMMNGRLEYPRTQSASPSEIKEPYEPSPRMYSYEQPSCLGSNFIGETLKKSDQLHQTFEKSSIEMTRKLDDMIKLPKSQPKRTYNEDLDCEIVMVKMPKCMAWLDDEPISDLDMMEDKVDNPSPQITPQFLPSVEVHTPPVTHLKEVEKTIGIQMEVEPLDHMKLEDLGLNTNTHDLFVSSRGFPSVDEPEPQLLPNFSPLDVNLGDKGGTDPPINPYSPGSFRMKEVKPLTIHTSPSPHMA
ncbi:reverse transcriptase domain-containing protein [Tanacetum coccineum]